LNADGTIANVSNYGDISSAQQTEYDADTDTLNVTQHYIGGNVGGIVGKAHERERHERCSGDQGRAE